MFLCALHFQLRFFSVSHLGAKFVPLHDNTLLHFVVFLTI
jgi:hypothetical protein